MPRKKQVPNQHKGEVKERKRPSLRSRKGEQLLASLTPQMLRFIDEYLVDMNAAEAVVRAGYRVAWPKKKAQKLLENDLIVAEIERRVKLRGEAAAISTVDVLKQLEAVVFLDVGELVDENNCLLPIKQLPVHVRKALAGFELVTVNGKVTAIKPVPSSRAKHTELLMKHLGMLDREMKPGDGAGQVIFNVNYGAPPAEPEPDRKPGVTIDGDKMEIRLPAPRKRNG